jgi:hypothetical protein
MLKHKLKKLGVVAESSDDQEDIKSLQAILDTAMELSVNNPYFKGRGSKKEYIKMIQHKLSKLGVHEAKRKKQQPTTRMDAYKKVRKSTMPKSRPMKSKKTYDRKKLRKGEDY